ncbi:MAG TPA: nitroreductase family protein, partial [Acidimicrobiales bacterium]|nr:nitroreductase family protein [Acidimicrobiales bacterium]
MIRNFDATPVPPELVEELIDVARRSPSAGYSQGVDFVVLQGDDETALFWDMPGVRDFWDQRFPGLLRVPVIVLPVADSGRYLRRYSEPDKAAAGLQEASAWPVPYWLVDTAMATMTLLLAVVDAGLGALFFGLREYGPLLERLGVPAD